MHRLLVGSSRVQLVRRVVAAAAGALGRSRGRGSAARRLVSRALRRLSALRLHMPRHIWARGRARRRRSARQRVAVRRRRRHRGRVASTLVPALLRSVRTRPYRRRDRELLRKRRLSRLLVALLVGLLRPRALPARLGSAVVRRLLGRVWLLVSRLFVASLLRRCGKRLREGPGLTGRRGALISGILSRASCSRRLGHRLVIAIRAHRRCKAMCQRPSSPVTRHSGSRRLLLHRRVWPRRHRRDAGVEVPRIDVVRANRTRQRWSLRLLGLALRQKRRPRSRAATTVRRMLL